MIVVRKAVVVLLAVACGAATTMSDAVAATPESYGSVRVPLDKTGEPGTVVASVHGVRRVPGATVLYYSIGVPADVDPAAVPKGFNGPGVIPPLGGGIGQASQVILDLKGGKAYQVLSTGPTRQLASDYLTEDDITPGANHVLYEVLPPVPDSTTSVAVRIGQGQVVPDVPVEDGLLEPAVPGATFTLLGEGWPEVDLGDLGEVADVSEFVVPLEQVTGTLDKSVTTTDRADTVDVALATDVLFAVDKATLTAKATDQLRRAADEINQRAAPGTIAVVGHTDSTGTDAHNLDLSKRRAAAVMAALKPLVTADGVSFTAQGKGESEPVADNGTDEGRQANRRVTVTFTAKDAS